VDVEKKWVLTLAETAVGCRVLDINPGRIGTEIRPRVFNLSYRGGSNGDNGEELWTELPWRSFGTSRAQDSNFSHREGGGDVGGRMDL
jgi:hypothetical protein